MAVVALLQPGAMGARVGGELQVRTVIEAGGAVLVDAGVVGPPPRPEHPTHLYLAGDRDRVAAVEAVFAGTGVTPVVVGAEVGQASAAKQAYALFNKGRVVLAALADRLAQAHGVRHVLEAEGKRPDAALLGELDEVRDGLTEVGWRWGPELDEIARTMTEAGLDPTVAGGLGAELRRRAR